jgi:NAD(P)H-dependent FMN reductase
VALLVCDGVEVACYDGLAALPQFNPDIDIDPAPAAVRALREQMAAADAVIISSPEYAHGVPGALKNALDWLVSGVEIYGKPVALLNPSPRSLFAHPQLAETLRTMGALIAPGASLSLPIAGRGLDAAGIAGDPDLAERLRGVLVALTSIRAPR